MLENKWKESKWQVPMQCTTFTFPAILQRLFKDFIATRKTNTCLQQVGKVLQQGFIKRAVQFETSI